MNKINPVGDKICTPGDININLFLNDCYILEKRVYLIATQFQVMLKATMNFLHFWTESNQ